MIYTVIEFVKDTNTQSLKLHCIALNMKHNYEEIMIVNSKYYEVMLLNYYENAKRTSQTSKCFLQKGVKLIKSI